MYLTTILERAARHPDEICFVTEDRRISLGELASDIAGLAAWLEDEGFGPGHTVGLSIKDGYRHLVAALALMRIGTLHVALPTHEPQTYREELAARTKAVAVLAEGAQAALATVQTVIPDFGFKTSATKPSPAVADDAVSIYLVSSGTTGRAKIVPFTQTQLYHQSLRSQWLARREVFYRPASIEHNIAKKHRLYSLLVGNVNLLVDPAQWQIEEACRAFGVTMLGLSGAQARTLIDGAQRGRKLPAETHLRVGGSPISHATRAEILASVSPNLYVNYGTSEFGSIATAGPFHHRTPPDCLGRVRPGVKLEIVDDDDRALPAGKSGSIRLRGSGMATGYFDDAAASARAFRSGWFYPGDAGHMTEDGLLCFAGRSDDMFILASINIFPAEIERVVGGLPEVRECAAFSVKSPDFGDIPLVAVVPKAPITADQILSYAKSKLGLKAPRKVYVVNQLPRTSHGKIDRGALRSVANSS